MVFANRALRRIFGHERNEVTGEWRKVNNGEFNDLCSSPNFIRVIDWKIMRWVGHAAVLRPRGSVYRVLVVNPEGNRLLGRPRCR